MPELKGLYTERGKEKEKSKACYSLDTKMQPFLHTCIEDLSVYLSPRSPTLGIGDNEDVVWPHLEVVDLLSDVGEGSAKSIRLVSSKYIT